MYEKHLCLGSREFLFTFTGQDVYNVRDSGVPDSMIYKNRTYSFLTCSIKFDGCFDHVLCKLTPTPILHFSMDSLITLT